MVHLHVRMDHTLVVFHMRNPVRAMKNMYKSHYKRPVWEAHCGFQPVDLRATHLPCCRSQVADRFCQAGPPQETGTFTKQLIFFQRERERSVCGNSNCLMWFSPLHKICLLAHSLHQSSHSYVLSVLFLHPTDVSVLHQTNKYRLKYKNTEKTSADLPDGEIHIHTRIQ